MYVWKRLMCVRVYVYNIREYNSICVFMVKDGLCTRKTCETYTNTSLVPHMHFHHHKRIKSFPFTKYTLRKSSQRRFALCIAPHSILYTNHIPCLANGLFVRHMGRQRQCTLDRRLSRTHSNKVNSIFAGIARSVVPIIIIMFRD